MSTPLPIRSYPPTITHTEWNNLVRYGIINVYSTFPSDAKINQIALVNHVFYLKTTDGWVQVGGTSTTSSGSYVSGSTTFDDITVQDMMKFKDTGYVIVDGNPVAATTPTSHYLYLFASTVSPMDHHTNLTEPMLMTNQAFFVEKDFQTFGFLGTATDPFKGYGGGAVLMGQGFTGLYCPPMFSLTGIFTSSAASFGGYASGSNFPVNPTVNQWFYKTSDKTLYQRSSVSWNAKYTGVESTEYNTLFLIRADTEEPANIYTKDVNTDRLIIRGSTSNFLWDVSAADSGSGVVYIAPNNNGNLGIGINTNQFRWIFTDDVYAYQGLHIGTSSAQINFTSVQYKSGSVDIKYLLPEHSNIGLGYVTSPLYFIDVVSLFTAKIQNYNSANQFITVSSPFQHTTYNTYVDTGLTIQITGSTTVLQQTATSTGNYLHLFASCVSPANRTTILSDPVLVTDQAFFVEKDFQTHGFVGTTSDPNKQYGGGAILMGQGFIGKWCPPLFDLVGDISARALTGSSILGYYRSGSTLPTGVKDEWFYRTTNLTLYKYSSTYGWQAQFPNVVSGNYDTLFLTRADTFPATANLYLNNLQCNSIYASNNVDYINFNAKLNLTGNLQLSGHVVSSINPQSGSTLALGNVLEPWTGVVATTVYTENFKHLDGTSWDFIGGGTFTSDVIIKKATPILQLWNTSGNPELWFNTSPNVSKIYQSMTGGKHLRFDSNVVFEQTVAIGQNVTIGGRLTGGIEKGSGSTNASGTASISFSSAFATTPVVICTPRDSAGRAISLVITSKSTTGFNIKTMLFEGGSHKHRVGTAEVTVPYTLTVSTGSNHRHSYSGYSSAEWHGHGFNVSIGSESQHKHAMGSMSNGAWAITPGGAYFSTLTLDGGTVGNVLASFPQSGQTLNTGVGSSHTHSVSATIDQTITQYTYSGWTGYDSGSSSWSHTHVITNGPSYARGITLIDQDGISYGVGTVFQSQSGSETLLYTDTSSNGAQAVSVGFEWMAF